MRCTRYVRYTNSVSELIKIGKRGMVTLPKEIIEKSQLKEGDTLLVDTNPDGSITLRPATALSIREYAEEDLKTFAEEDELSPELAVRVKAFLKD